MSDPGRTEGGRRDTGDPPHGDGGGDRRDPHFGPSGYLPERAAKRARKIVLRSPLGLQWVIASVVAGVVIVVAAAIFLTQAGGPPGGPYVEVGPVDAVGDARFDGDRDLLYVGAVGKVRAFAVDPDDVPVYCAESRQLESPGGRVWSPTGRALDGGVSLREHPTVVVDGVVYVDPTRSAEVESPEDSDPVRACF